ncbi:HNH endonuclease family protein [Curtobacterium sp. VKM Ac-2922]|uniref:HNH endonuclease family protein n=1 Tax=Curtobacterium sp. VKM Ac-2922 TaxID=2929475 RepID=UPI001FB49BD5|nr:HNH endonuclease family protein [Curtobacterium sp. VKM Ac-2922]MCJ1715395.1 HNH endonuclease family protein [Curtobacterium sp. VKM Ac-2922]
MTSRRRRTTRLTLSSSLILIGIAVLGYALHATGAPPSQADGTPATGAAPTVSATARGTAAPVPEPTRASSPADSPAGSPGDPAPDGAADPAADSPADVATARAQLAALPVKGKAPATGYDRTADFGTAWLDVDHNGCDTRNDVLARDLTDVVRSGPCRVTSGELRSPYTGTTIDFVRGNTTSTLVQIDHVVALENAWVTGAQQLSQGERQALANDPDNLFAVDGHSNAQKRSGDAATWLPAATAFRCTYVEHQVTVKTRYRLWVAPAEQQAMTRVLDRC